MADNFHVYVGFVLTAYLYIFAIAVFCIECNLLRARVWFYFMNYSLGKAIFYGIMSLLCFGSGTMVNWFDILVGVVCGLVSCFFIFLYCTFKDEEGAFVQRMIEDMNTRQAMKQTTSVNVSNRSINVN